MENIGYIALAFFGVVGFVIAALAIWEYLSTQFRLIAAKIGKEVEVRKENINAQGESKKLRLAKKRAIQDAIKDKRMDKKINKIKGKANEEFGEEVFKLEPSAPPIVTEPAFRGDVSPVAPAADSPAPVSEEHAPRPTIKPAIRPTPKEAPEAAE